MAYDNELRGILFPTKEKRHEKSPDYYGQVQVLGVTYKLSGSRYDDAKGRRLSLKLELMDDQGGPRGRGRPADDENVPF